MPDFGAFLPLLSIAIALSAAIGVVIAFVGNKNRGMSEVQTNTITALQAQNTAQEKQIQVLEKKITRLEGVFFTLQVTLKKRRGLLIEVNDDVITLIDQRTGVEHVVQIHTTGQLEKIAQQEEGK